VAPTGRYLRDLAEALVERGHSVIVICSRRSYDGGCCYPGRETREGVRVLRVPAFGFGRRTLAGRIADYASFWILAAFRVLTVRPKPGLLLALTTPPFIGLLVHLAAHLRRTRHAHWIMDVYPDVMVAHGMLRAGGAGHRLLNRLAAAELCGSALNVTVGPDMAGRIHERTGAPVRPVPLWTTGDLDSCPPPDDGKKEGADKLVLTYSGNMGLGHRLEEFLEAALRLCDDKRFHWMFTGGGKRMPEVLDFHRSHADISLETGPYVPAGELSGHLRGADVHLVSLDSAWKGCILPSKLQAAFAVGRPVIFVGPPDSTLARWVNESGGGWVVDEGDVETLVRAVLEATDVEERRKRGEAGKQFAENTFSKRNGCKQICELLEECIEV